MTLSLYHGKMTADNQGRYVSHPKVSRPQHETVARDREQVTPETLTVGARAEGQ
jgi:hypothetical protein